MLIAFLGDAHLGYRQYDLHERKTDYLNAFSSAVQQILTIHEKTPVAAVVQMGDLFHHARPSNGVLLSACNELKKLVNRGIQVYILPGNHDFQRMDRPPAALLEAMGVGRLATSEDRYELPGIGVADIGNVRIVFLRYLNRAELRFWKSYASYLEKLKKDGAMNILATHVPVNSEQFFLGPSAVKAESLPEGYRLYVLGHQHDFGMCQTGKKTLLYTGAVEWTSISERPTKKLFLLNTEKGKIKSYVIPTRPKLVLEKLPSSPAELRELAQQAYQEANNEGAELIAVVPDGTAKEVERMAKQAGIPLLAVREKAQVAQDEARNFIDTVELESGLSDRITAREKVIEEVLAEHGIPSEKWESFKTELFAAIDQLSDDTLQPKERQKIAEEELNNLTELVAPTPLGG